MSLAPNPKYLLDANVLIQAKNFQYRFQFCQIFWDWIEKAHQANFVFSVNKVKIELENGKADDPVRTWIDKLPNNFFLLDIKDPSVSPCYSQLMTWIASNNHYTKQAKDEFARPNVADAFLIAVAKTHGYTIVTHEKGNPDRKSRVLIPDAANHFGVSSIMVYDLLSLHAKNNFSLKL
ncbi:hypothetical protein MTYM_01866 [Methylococcales bacterium]|nr:hypothetical protein MTYM_01866 [Methylococcales bacterium]